MTNGYQQSDYELAQREIARLNAEIERLEAEALMSAEIGGTFWGALKMMNLTHINISNPGQHVVDVIVERDTLRHQLTEARQQIAEMARPLVAPQSEALNP